MPNCFGVLYEKLILYAYNGRLLGLMGQFFAFLAMIIPIVAGNFEALGFLLIVSAASNIAAIFFSVSCGHIIPSLRSERRVRVAVVSAVSLSVLMFLAFSLVAFLIYIIGFGNYWAKVLVAVAIFTTALVFYALVLASLVRREEESTIFKLGFAYGGVLIVLTTVFIAFGATGENLVTAYILSTVSALFLIKNRAGEIAGFLVLNQVAQISKKDFRLVCRYFFENRSIVLGNMVAAAASQVATLSINYSAEFHAYWTVTLRIVGGFGTTVSQLIAPSLEGKFARNFRRREYGFALVTATQTIKLGLILGVFFFVVALLGCYWVGWRESNSLFLDLIFIPAILIYGVANGVGFVFLKFPGLAGLRQDFFILASIKIFVAILMLWAFEAKFLILMLALTDAFYQVILCLIVWRSMRRFRV